MGDRAAIICDRGEKARKQYAHPDEAADHIGLYAETAPVTTGDFHFYGI
jgi:hypothetical protein